MRYMLLVYFDEHAWSEADRGPCYIESGQIPQELNAEGKYLDAAPLLSVSTATSVRVRDGKREVTDGPFAETREQLGGFFLIEADNLDQGLDIPGRIPAAKRGTVEVRPVREVAGLPSIG